MTKGNPRGMDVLAQRAGPIDLVLELELRAEPMPEPEKSEAAQIGVGSLVPWPIAPEQLIDFYMSNPWLAAIGYILADAVSGAAPELKAREADLEGQPIERGNSAKQDADYARGMAWLSRDNVGGDGVSELSLSGLLWAVTRTFDQVGNAFLEVVRDRGATEPLRLINMLPQFLRYEAVGDQGQRTIDLYQMDPFSGERRFVPFGQRPAGDTEHHEFLHMRLPNTLSTFYGLPMWIEARDSVTVDNAHRAYLKGFFKNHGTPRYLIEVTQDPNWQGLEPDPKKVAQVYQHAKNFLSANAGDMAGRNLIIQHPGGILIKATALDNKIEDPTFPSTAKNARDEILAVRHVSLINLGLPDNSNRATSQTQSDDFRVNVLEPFAAPAVTLINRVLHSPKPSGLGIGAYDFALKFERVADTLAKIEGIVKATGTPVLTPDEGRQILGYEAKGEDALYVPVNLVPALPSEE